MKKVLSNLIAPVVILATIFACEDDISNKFDTLDIAPVIDGVTPDGNVKIGTEFDIVIKVSDGEQSPLASVSATLWEDSVGGNELATTSGTVSGTSDSIVWAAADFGSTALDTGDYVVQVTATDAANLSTTGEFGFTIFDLPFNANYASMYALGSFNGWGGTAEARADWAFELVADNTWVLDTLQLSAGDEFKFSVNPDFDATDPSNEDWGDTDCDMVMEAKSGPGGNGNTSCGYDGKYKVTFNDETFIYSMDQIIELESSINGLYLVGTMNGFKGSDDYEFRLVDDNTWEIAEAFLQDGDNFYFSEQSNFSGDSWGDNEPDGVADKFGDIISHSGDEGFYRVTFNDMSFEYTVEYVRGNFGLYIIGDASVAGWDNTQAFGMQTTGDMQYRTYQYLSSAGGFQFLPNQGSWDGQIGKGATDGSLTTSGGGNITVATDGFYRIDVDLNALTYTVTASNWGIIGDATPGGWDADTDMTAPSALGEFEWTINITLTDGEVKFRENDDWALNYGTGGDCLSVNGGNIAVSAGTYNVTLNLDSEAGFCYTIE